MNILVELMKDYASKIGEIQSVDELKPIQEAFRQISAPLIADFIAISVLLERGLVGSAETLMRPQVERLATMAYLRKNGSEETENWFVGYRTRSERPKLEKRIQHMDPLRNPFTGGFADQGEVFAEFVQDYANTLHSLQHGDRASSYRSLARGNNEEFFVAGSNPFDLEGIGRVSNFAGLLICYLLQELNELFPQLKDHYLGNAA